MNRFRLKELRVIELTPQEALEFAVLGLEPEELFPLLVSFFPGLKIELPDRRRDVIVFEALSEEEYGPW
jgi:hypothetical protein